MAGKEEEFWERELTGLDFSGLTDNLSNLSPIDVLNIRRMYGALRTREGFSEILGLAPIETRSNVISYACRLGATREEAEAIVLRLENESETPKPKQAPLPGGLFGKIKRLFGGAG